MLQIFLNHAIPFKSYLQISEFQPYGLGRNFQHLLIILVSFKQEFLKIQLHLSPSDQEQQYLPIYVECVMYCFNFRFNDIPYMFLCRLMYQTIAGTNNPQLTHHSRSLVCTRPIRMGRLLTPAEVRDVVTNEKNSNGHSVYIRNNEDSRFLINYMCYKTSRPLQTL